MAELLLTSAAELDYTEALCWYTSRSPEAAERFESVIDDALTAIASDPERFPRCDEQHRYYFLDRFPFQIIYRIQEPQVWVVAIAHTSRSDTFWRKR